MKKLYFYFFLRVCICSTLLSFSCKEISKPKQTQSANALDSLLTPISEIHAANTNHVSDIVVTVKGKITKILSDDTAGDRHQRFIIQLSNRQTILITHNIDIAPRVVGIIVGSVVYVHGDYVWNSQGGLVHWTHHDPDGLHENGWIVFGDKKYQ
jgi:hypothetical protein